MKVLYEKETENVSRETFSVSFLRKKLFSLISCGSLWSKVIQTSTVRGFYAMLSLLSRSSAGAGSAMGKAACRTNVCFYSGHMGNEPSESCTG